MRILYYSREEITKDDACEALRRMGHEVELFCFELKDYNRDAEFSGQFLRKLEEVRYDLVFSFYFIPLISKLSLNKKIRYAVWLFDPMPLTMYSVMAFNPYAYIFSFDKKDCEEWKKRGVLHVFHLPLACNPDRIRRLFLEKTDTKGQEELIEQNEVAFIGNLYNGDTNLFDQIAYLPEAVLHRVDDLISEQLETTGNDVLKAGMDDALAEELSRYVTLELSDEYVWTAKDIFLNMIFRKAAAMERLRLLERLSEQFSVTLYSASDSSCLPRVRNLGYVDYSTKMPLVIAHSKINLHITPRAITSGMSLRIFDVMAAGGFLLSNAQPELFTYFEEGKDFVAYENERDLAEKAAYYLSHDDKRKDIAANGQRKALERFSYETQFETMFRILEQEEGREEI